MSELTPCNYCSLRRIRANANGKTVEVVKTSSTDLLAQWPKTVDVKVDGRVVATMLEVTEECVC